MILLKPSGKTKVTTTIQNSSVHKRIILTGAGGVGKTTLASRLADKLSLPLIPELVRQLCHDLGYKKIGDIPDQEGFKRLALDAQIKSEDKHESFVADRSAFDYWVLWQRWNICSAMTHDTESFYQLARARTDKYTHVIYVPPMFAPEDDGLRWADLDYQRQLDRIVKMTLYEWDLWGHTHTVRSDGLDHRLAEVTDWLSSH